MTLYRVFSDKNQWSATNGAKRNARPRVSIKKGIKKVPTATKSKRVQKKNNAMNTVTSSTSGEGTTANQRSQDKQQSTVPHTNDTVKITPRKSPRHGSHDIAKPSVVAARKPPAVAARKSFSLSLLNSDKKRLASTQISSSSRKRVAPASLETDLSARSSSKRLKNDKQNVSPAETSTAAVSTTEVLKSEPDVNDDSDSDTLYSINTSCELEDKQHLHLKLLDNGDIGTECSTPGSKIDISVRQSPKCVRLEKNELYQLTGT